MSIKRYRNNFENTNKKMKFLILLAVILCHASGELFTPEEEQALLDIHNELRRQEGASNMLEMKWDPTLALQASAWSDQCVMDHGNPTNIQTNFGYVGQNLFMTESINLNPTDGINFFYKEKDNYNYDAMKCTNVCGHYTQVVWAKSEYLGCAATYCPKLYIPSNDITVSGSYMVCNYGPGGNMKGSRPFKQGPACSECPTGYKCRNSLCFKP